MSATSDERRVNIVAVCSDLVPDTHTGPGQLHAFAVQVRPGPRPSAPGTFVHVVVVVIIIIIIIIVIIAWDQKN